MRKFHVFTFIAALTVLILNNDGCSPNSTVPTIPLKPGETTANVTGFGTFYAINALADSNSNITYHFRASVLNKTKNDSLVVEMVVTKKSPIPYTIDLSTDDFSLISYCIVQMNGSCKNYIAQKGSGSGSIRITDLSPTLQGSFSGMLQLVGGSETITISGGEFNAAWK